jgi:hypothetical protein
MADLYGTSRKHETLGCSCCGSNEEFLGRQEVTQTDDNDVALAKEMNELSVKERERVFDDIHGVAEVQDETPDFVGKRLAEMDLALAATPKARRKALDRALFFKPSIETDVKFKLMFLRADHYDAQKAGKRMAKYFEEKLELFGEEKLAKRITLDDLAAEDLRRLNFVGCVILPHKDQTGRPIWFFDVSRFDLDHLESMVRGWFVHV